MRTSAVQSTRVDQVGHRLLAVDPGRLQTVALLYSSAVRHRVLDARVSLQVSYKKMMKARAATRAFVTLSERLCRSLQGSTPCGAPRVSITQQYSGGGGIRTLGG